MDQLRLLRTAELPWTKAVRETASAHAENVKDELDLNLQLPEDLETVIRGRIWCDAATLSMHSDGMMHRSALDHVFIDGQPVQCRQSYVRGIMPYD